MSKAEQELIEATKTKVNEVANAAISRVIEAREAAATTMNEAKVSVSQVVRAVENAKRELAEVEHRVGKAIDPLSKKASSMEKRLDDLLDLLRRSEMSAQAAGALCGKRVTLVGGNQKMTAGAMDDDGMIVCYYEVLDGPHGAIEIRSVTLHPAALELQEAPKAAAKRARK